MIKNLAEIEKEFDERFGPKNAIKLFIRQKFEEVLKALINKKMPKMICTQDNYYNKGYEVREEILKKKISLFLGKEGDGK